jgi:hypothetical protein
MVSFTAPNHWTNSLENLSDEKGLIASDMFKVRSQVFAISYEMVMGVTICDGDVTTSLGKASLSMPFTHVWTLCPIVLDLGYMTYTIDTTPSSSSL